MNTICTMGFRSVLACGFASLIAVVGRIPWWCFSNGFEDSGFRQMTDAVFHSLQAQFEFP